MSVRAMSWSVVHSTTAGPSEASLTCTPVLSRNDGTKLLSMDSHSPLICDDFTLPESQVTWALLRSNASWNRAKRLGLTGLPELQQWLESEAGPAAAE